MRRLSKLDEYRLVSDNIRWYSSIRFAQLTLFSAVTAAAITATYSTGLNIPLVLSVFLRIGAALVSVAFWYLEVRADAYWVHFMTRAEALERTLGFRQYSRRPKRKLRTTLVIRTLIIGVALFWLATLLPAFAGHAR